MQPMDNATGEIKNLAHRLQVLRDATLATQQQLMERWHPHLHHRHYLPSAANLAAYIGLRRHDLRELQAALAAVGLSSLGRCEGHVMATLDAVSYALAMMNGAQSLPCPVHETGHAMQHDRQLLRHNTDLLFGKHQGKRSTRIMVTLPSEAADDHPVVREMLTLGMDCARINCAHDTPASWEKMVANIRQAEHETGRPCRIMFDLSGPKLRTGEIAAGPEVLHVRIKRDDLGDRLYPTRIILDGTGSPGQPATTDKLGKASPARLSVPAKWLHKLKPGDKIRFHDMRKRKREFVVEQRLSDTEVQVSCEDGAYIAPGTILERIAEKKQRAQAGKTASGDFLAPPMRIHLRKNDALLLARDPSPGQAERRDKAGRILSPARISCSEPEVFAFLEAGHAVWIDDGRIGCVIERVDAEGAWLRVTQVRPEGEHVGAQKGLNFPDSHLQLPALSEKDLRDLDFAVQHADIIGLSFVQSADDLDRLAEALKKRNASALGIIAKIETRQAVKNLPEIIVRGAGHGPFGVMIARGDLAVEIGYERMAEIQEEMLWLCEAAHIPVTWATQVLESLVKLGLPSRAEISDAAMSGRAECVMLNKGPYILHALSVLDDIVTRMQAHLDKKTSQYRALHW
ncbi:pyruvate kinase family protein [Sulfuriferula multivorans]|uniref:pyruvate kinase n=2 Tax=Sulfuriferula multivorans TaxID=1559896 RepID=A0A401JZV9_9PROT|nr:pyruvate kinase family protein [Sulfuriferula multivorans]